MRFLCGAGLLSVYSQVFMIVELNVWHPFPRTVDGALSSTFSVTRSFFFLIEHIFAFVVTKLNSEMERDFIGVSD